jgi:hypothetical protein
MHEKIDHDQYDCRNAQHPAQQILAHDDSLTVDGGAQAESLIADIIRLRSAAKDRIAIRFFDVRILSSGNDLRYRTGA